MPRVSHYRPNSIIMPASTGLERDYLDPRPHHKGVAALTAEDWAGHDKDTLLHDVFFDCRNGDLLAIGPPPVNLKKHLWPWTVRARADAQSEAHTLVARKRNLLRCQLYRFRLPRALHSADRLEVEFDFNGVYTERVTVKPLTLRPVFLQFATLQKDNAPIWIEDWIRYLESIGVERVLLYDNASAYAERLVEFCERFNSEMEILCIDWPFNYGPVNSHHNKFTQAGQINHANLALGYCAWQGNYDIDEYPLSVPAGALRQYLAALPHRVGLLRSDNHMVRTDRQFDHTPRVVDLPMRERALRGKSFKYIVRPEALWDGHTHNAWLRPFRFRRQAPPEHAFLHYERLSTNWRSYVDRHQSRPLEAEHFIEDRRVIEQMDSIGITEDRFEN